MARRRSDRSLWAAYVAAEAQGRPRPRPDRQADPSANVRSAVSRRFSGYVLGIDPSVRSTGLAVVRFPGDRSMSLVASATVRNRTKLSMPECLAAIGRAIRELISRHPVDQVAIEETIFVQNFRTAQLMGAARGAAITTAALADLPIFEYAPLRIKQAVVGYGRASKEQMAKQICALLKLGEPLPPDEADAAGVAVCHALAQENPLTAP